MKRIGLTNLSPLRVSTLKRDLLFFDTLYFDNIYFMKARAFEHADLVRYGKDFAHKQISSAVNDITYLVDKNILKPINGVSEFLRLTTMEDIKVNPQTGTPIVIFKFTSAISPEFQSAETEELLLNTISTAIGDDREKGKNIILRSPQESARWLKKAEDDLILRNKLFVLLKQYTGDDNLYTPVFSSNKLSQSKLLREKDVSLMTLKRFPIPDENTPLEAILDFREDHDNQQRLLGLRRWMSNMATSSRPIGEIEEELTYTLSEYEKALKLHKLKYHSETLEFAVVTALEILENIVKLNWSKAANTLFSIRKKKIDYLIDEAKLPGRELAYIAQAKQVFNK